MPITHSGDNKIANLNSGASELIEVDARGMRCPLPLLKAKQALRDLPKGRCLRIVATDAGSVRDFHSFVKLTGNSLLSFLEQQGEYTYIIQKNQ